MRSKKALRTTAITLLAVILVGCIAVFSIDAYVVFSTKDRILLPENATEMENIDCIIVLGCQVKADGVPSHMLEDRLRRGVELYQANTAPKLLMSGDHGRTDYHEVGAMKQYAIDAGVPSSDVFMDHAGFSTYETIYRAKEIFGAERVLIVTQEYHLHRALYIAKQLGVEAYGVNADYRTYHGQFMRDVREILARCKDVAKTTFRVPPTYLGDTIPISGDGDATND